MEEHRYGNPADSDSSPGSVKFSLPICQKVSTLTKEIFSLPNQISESSEQEAAVLATLGQEAAGPTETREGATTPGTDFSQTASQVNRASRLKLLGGGGV